ncbi:MAG: putative transporter, type 2 [Clostridia bacterium]|nr:putative transporter, type 2 [Clostridia bacterium]
MNLLFKCIREEIQFTSKKAGLLILLFVGLPFLTTWFAGAYYHPYVNDVPVAVLDEDQTELSRSIIQYFNQSERFDIIYYASSREELQKYIDEEKVYMGLYIPPHLNDNILSGEAAQVLILTNGTNVVIGNNAYAGAAEIIQTVSAGAEIKIISAKGSLPQNTANNMALSFQFTDRMLYDSKLTYMNYLIYGFIAVFFQQLMLSGLATLILRNPKETATGNTGIKLAAKVIVAATALIAAGAFTVGIIHTKLNVILAANMGSALLMCLLFATAISAPAILLCAITKDKIKFSQLAYMLSLPTFLTCGYVWPADQMPELLMWFVKLTWPLIYFARTFDEIMVKGLPFEAVRQNAINLVLYSIVFIPIAVVVFKKRFGIQIDEMVLEKTDNG